MNKPNLQSNSNNISKWETPRLINSAEADISDQKRDQESIADAYTEAQKLGYQEGLDQASAEIAQRIDTLQNFLTVLCRPFNDQNHQLVRSIAALSGKIAKGLVRRELRTDPETIMALVRETVTALNTTAKEVSVHLNPDNARIIRELVNSNSREQTWQIFDDPLISRSDCKVSSRDSTIDADLQTRIDLIITQILGDERNENSL